MHRVILILVSCCCVGANNHCNNVCFTSQLTIVLVENVSECYRIHRDKYGDDEVDKVVVVMDKVTQPKVVVDDSSYWTTGWNYYDPEAEPIDPSKASRQLANLKMMSMSIRAEPSP